MDFATVTTEFAEDLDRLFELIVRDPYVDPRPLYNEFRRRSPVYQTPYGAWWVTTFADAQRVLTDRSSFTVDWAQSSIGEYPHVESFAMRTWGRSLNVTDGDKHRRLHDLVKDLFRPAVVKQLRNEINETVQIQLDLFGDRDQLELRAEFAELLPTRIILKVLGLSTEYLHVFAEVPESLAQMVEPDVSLETLAWGDQIWRDATRIIERLAEERRTAPREDLLTRLVQASADSDQLTQDELVSMVLLLVVAGQETTGQMICSGLYHLMAHPAQLAAVRSDRTLVPRAIEEALRYDTPVRVPATRYALQDVELGGQFIRRGEPVMVCLQAANHDPAVFDNANDFDIHRKAGRHLGFGSGHHHCLGSALARLELEIVWNAVLDRYRTIESPPRLAWKPRFKVRGLEALPLRVELTAAPM